MRGLRQLFVIAFLSACGAGAQTGGGAESAGGGDADDAVGDGVSGADSTSGSTAAKGPDCSDGTCFACGDGFCPKGFYCDKQAGGCSWLPECADEASCACVSRVLSDCSCSEDGGGVYCE